MQSAQPCLRQPLVLLGPLGTFSAFLGRGLLGPGLAGSLTGLLHGVYFSRGSSFTVPSSLSLGRGRGGSWGWIGSSVSQVPVRLGVLHLSPHAHCLRGEAAVSGFLVFHQALSALPAGNAATSTRAPWRASPEWPSSALGLAPSGGCKVHDLFRAETESGGVTKSMRGVGGILERPHSLPPK